MTSDPLLQPYQIKHLHLRNRIMSTAHEPAYSEDGLPKERYRLTEISVPHVSTMNKLIVFDLIF